METKLMTKREVAELLGYHPEHVARLARQGALPKPIRLGASRSSRVAWVRREVERWLEKKMAERDAEASRVAGAPE